MIDETYGGITAVEKNDYARRKSLERRKMTDSTLKNPAFQQACERAGIPVTRRQARKWNMKKGKAWKEGRE